MPPERPVATFRFYEELNDFLPAASRKRDIAVPIDRSRPVKDAIESVGVPHPEVDLVLVDGVSVGFDHALRGGERVAVYPMFERLDVGALQRLRPRALRDPRFIADANLGKLARHLRMAGFDVLFDARAGDAAIAACSAASRRTILTRDKGLLRRRGVERGYYVRADAADVQLAEVIAALQLETAMRPFTRCRECNAPLEDLARDGLPATVPRAIVAMYDAFRRCPVCGRVYWPGSHYARMTRLLERARDAQERQSR
ncbi:MAG TPA: Mut7-C RNAse domain-containing protein [Usitatibacter sp.]|jgi:hypothetical protein|nr:Mut7-C RNAse domain-containing protein [Usitatibacter sp.]